MNVSALLHLQPGTQLINTATQQTITITRRASPSRLHGWRATARTQHGTIYITPHNITNWRTTGKAGGPYKGSNGINYHLTPLSLGEA